MWPFCTHQIISCHSYFYDMSLPLPLINLLIFDGVTVASHPINGMCTYTWQFPETWRKSVKEAVAQTFLPRSTFVLTGLPVQFGSLCGTHSSRSQQLPMIIQNGDFPGTPWDFPILCRHKIRHVFCLRGRGGVETIPSSSWSS